MFFIERMISNNWIQLSGPWYCEQTAFIHAKNYANGSSVTGPLRIVTENGAVVNIL